MRHIVKTAFAAAALAIVGVQYLSHRPATATATPPVPAAPRPTAFVPPPAPAAAPQPQYSSAPPPSRIVQEPVQVFRRPPGQ